MDAPRNDELHDDRLGPVPAAAAPAAAAPAAAAGMAAGWYRDPWGPGYRWWNGAAWTSDAFADVPMAGAAQEPWSRSPTPPPVSGRGKFAAKLVAAALVTGLLGFAAGVGIAQHRGSTRRSAARAPARSVPGRPIPVPTVPAAPTDRASSSLNALVLHQADVADTISVETIRGGAAVDGETTLDVCNAAYPSEDLRTARRQVVATDDTGVPLLSTEAVLYRDAAATAQAFSELRAAAAACPATPVPSPVGGSTLTTHFNAAPDAAWPQTPTVERVAFDMVTTDDTGEQTHDIAVYLRRGRALLGVYFSRPDAVPAVGGTTDIGAIVAGFAGRLAALPTSVVGG